MNNKIFKGIMPALPTAINPDSTYRPAEAEKLMRHLFRTPIRGFYINGGTGEGPVLPEKTRMENAELAVSIAKGRGIIINQIGSPDTQSALALAKHAAKIGCDAVSSLIPSYYFHYPAERILDYFRAVAEVSGLPVLVYANNLMTVEPYDFMRRVMEIPGVIGLKYTMPDYYQLQRISGLCGGNINVINGPDQTLLCGLAMGADGGIGSTYNVMPEWFCALYDAMQENDLVKAKDCQRKINRVITVLKKHEVLPSVKAYFRYLGIDIGNIAYPGTVLSAEQCASLITELKDCSVPSLLA